MAPGRRKEPSAARFKIRFKGADMTPARVRLGELSDLLSSLEAAIAALSGAAPEQVGFSLVDVQSRSASYALASSGNEATIAMRLWSAAIKGSDLSTLPAPAQEASRKILAFVKRHNCTGELTESGKRAVLAKVTPQTVLEDPNAAAIEGATTIYGVALRIGGTTPRLSLRISDGRPVTVDLASRSLAREIAKRLYTFVGVAGVARWDLTTNAMVAFTAQELLPYEGAPIEALDDAARLVGADLSKLVDVEDELDRVRSMADL
jgi:hypothetical protein